MRRRIPEPCAQLGSATDHRPPRSLVLPCLYLPFTSDLDLVCPRGADSWPVLMVDRLGSSRSSRSSRLSRISSHSPPGERASDLPWVAVTSKSGPPMSSDAPWQVLSVGRAICLIHAANTRLIPESGSLLLSSNEKHISTKLNMTNLSPVLCT